MPVPQNSGTSFLGRGIDSGLRYAINMHMINMQTEDAMARTTLEIDDTLLETAKELCGARTKTEAVDLALRELVRSRERGLLREELGAFEIDLDLEELRSLRQAP
ncbi:MAG: type II toxin-antitoxin system VapB family antitoxin [Chloroflexi bacterium]|nr:type II toxin-antitoxin system VapB family antitoxin [Chloroflexota bacterium]